MVQRQEEVLQLNNRVIEQFALAVKECAEQLASHTEAVKGMASASQELREAVREMNRMLGQADKERKKGMRVNVNRSLFGEGH